MNVIPPLPPWVTLEVSNDCQCRCIMCTVREKDCLAPGMMDLQTVDAFLDGLRRDHFRTAGVRLFWLGEPTLHPDFGTILQRFRAADLVAEGLVPRIGFDTNGQGLATWADDILDLARDLPVHIILSLDAVRPDTYARIRPGGDFSRALDGLERLLTGRRQRGSLFPRLCLQFIIMDENAAELPEFLDHFGSRFAAFAIRPRILLNASFATDDGFNLRPMTWQGSGQAGRQDTLNRLYRQTLAAAGIHPREVS